jgi:hypothetical protein
LRPNGWRDASKNKKRAAQDYDNPVQTNELGGELIVCIACTHTARRILIFGARQFTTKTINRSLKKD